MIHATELREKREKYQKSIKGELDRIESVLGYYTPETANNVTCQLMGSTFYEMKDNLEKRGFSVRLVEGYHGEDMDTVVAKNINSYITVAIDF